MTWIQNMSRNAKVENNGGKGQTGEKTLQPPTLVLTALTIMGTYVMSGE
jgi:hypothetical protein